MSEIKKKRSEVVLAINIASQITQQTEQALKAMAQLEKDNKGKADLKKELEDNAKNKPILEEQNRVYTAFLKSHSKYGEEHNDLIMAINIDHALETEVSPKKGDTPAVNKLVLDDKGEFCYDREAEKKRQKALKELNAQEIFVKQFSIETTLTEKPDQFEGFMIFEKAKEKAKAPVKKLPVKK